MKAKKMKMRNNKGTVSVFIAYFAALVMSYSVFLNQIVTSDFIALFDNRKTTFSSDLFKIIASGRYYGIINESIYKLMQIFGVTRYNNTYVLQLMGMVLYACSATILFMMCESYIHTEEYKVRLFLWISILIAFVNPYIIETYFWGAFDFAQGVLMGVIAVWFWKKKKFLLSYVFSFLAMICYENNIMIILILILFLDFFQSHDVEKKSFLKYIKMGFTDVIFCVCVSITDFVVQRFGIIIANSLSHNDEKVELYKSIRVPLGTEGLLFVARNIKKVIWNCYGTLPQGILLLVIVGMIFLGAITVAKNHNINKALYYTGMTLVCIMAILSWSFLGVSLTMRITYSIFFVVSMLFVLLLTELYNVKVNKRYFVAGLLLFVFVFLYYNTQVCNTDMYISQTIDEYEARTVERIIENYEMKTGKNISTIATCGGTYGVKDMDNTYLYEGLLKKYSGDVPFYRMYYFAWAQGGKYLNYVNGTNYKSRLMTIKEIDKYFGDEKNTLGYFNPEEQLVFEGDTLYWRVY